MVFSPKKRKKQQKAPADHQINGGLSRDTQKLFLLFIAEYLFRYERNTNAQFQH